MSYIKVEDLSLGYDSEIVCSNINFEINKNDYLCIIGENGAGKSTLIKTILDLKEKVTNLTTYSTNEIKTGKFWNDGKPIYRKTLIYTNKEIANGTIIAHSIQNINEVTDFEVRFNDNGTLYTLPLIYEGTGSKMYVRCNKTSIVF